MGGQKFIQVLWIFLRLGYSTFPLKITIALPQSETYFNKGTLHFHTILLAQQTTLLDITLLELFRGNSRISRTIWVFRTAHFFTAFLTILGFDLMCRNSDFLRSVQPILNLWDSIWNEFQSNYKLHESVKIRESLLSSIAILLCHFVWVPSRFQNIAYVFYTSNHRLIMPFSDFRRLSNHCSLHL